MKGFSNGIALTVLLFSALSTGVATAQDTMRVIRDNETGGDCVQIGIWDNESKTCTLTSDLMGSISIDDAGITLEGDGNTLIGKQTGTGVAIGQRPQITNVTVKNLTVDGFAIGIEFGNSSTGNYTIADNIITNNGTGLRKGAGSYDSIFRNVIIHNGTGLCIGFTWGDVYANNAISSNGIGIETDGKSTSSKYVNNLFENNDVAMAVGYWMGNEFSNNTVSDSRSAGIVHIAHGTSPVGANKIYNNNFIGNPAPQVSLGLPPSPGSYTNQFGGNYWSNWTSPDANNDGYVDQPYQLDNGQDNAPWVKRSGWLMLDIDALINQTTQACTSGQITKPTVCQNLSAKLTSARTYMERGRFDTARSKLSAYIAVLNSKPSKVIPVDVYQALKLAAENLLDRLI